MSELTVKELQRLKDNCESEIKSFINLKLKELEKETKLKPTCEIHFDQELYNIIGEEPKFETVVKINVNI